MKENERNRTGNASVTGRKIKKCRLGVDKIPRYRCHSEALQKQIYPTAESPISRNFTIVYFLPNRWFFNRVSPRRRQLRLP